MLGYIWAVSKLNGNWIAQVGGNITPYVNIIVLKCCAEYQKGLKHSTSLKILLFADISLAL